MGVSARCFLAVDRALMTDIIAKASSGHSRGISNAATASAGVFATAFGGRPMDFVGGVERLGSRPRADVAGGRLLCRGCDPPAPVREPPRRATVADDTAVCARRPPALRRPARFPTPVRPPGRRSCG